MKNLLVAKVLYEIGEMLEIKGVDFKPRAYFKAARTVEGLGKPIEGVEGLESLPGIGEGIAKKIRELIKTGKLRYYESLKKEMPFNFDELMSVEGMGPKKVKRLYDALGVKDLKDLKKAAEQGKIRGLEGFGEKSESNILKNINVFKKTKDRLLLSDALLIADELVSKLELFAEKIDYAGSLRRMTETIGDIDILAVPKSEELVKVFLDQGSKIVKGSTKASIRLPVGVQVDLRLIKLKSYGAALQYFTGSKAHNIAVRKLAIKKGYKLNEYGLFKGDKLVAGKTEKQVYDKLGLLTVPPELRENTGELELKSLPDLVTKVRGDLQMHSDWSDGVNSVEEMITAAQSLGYEYVGLSDHAGNLPIANALSPARIRKQISLFSKLKKKFKGIQVLHSLEVNIKPDGSLDVPNSLLKELDYVLVGVHSKFRQTQKQMTDRVVKALSNDYVNALVHPTNRLINAREGVNLDLGRVFEVAKDHGVFLEVDAQPKRLDLPDVLVRSAVKAGCKIIIDTDAHSIDQLKYMRFGIATARRGWAENKDVVNALPWPKFRKAFLK